MLLVTFLQKLDQAITKNNSLLCVGLDPDLTKLPTSIRDEKDTLFVFNKAIIDATADVVCAYKPNSAFYEGLGAKGIEQLKLTTDYLRESYSHIPIILDAKRADIGNTNNGYAEFAFHYLVVDAITLHPYLGKESLEPFLAYKEKGIIILCRTSNEGAGEFQDLKIDGLPLYQFVARQVTKYWNSNNNCLLVVGATYPAELKAIRQIVGPNVVLLVPGVGAQGGDVAAVMSNGIGASGRELIINSSRGIIFASSGDDFAEAARKAAILLRNEINDIRSVR